MSRSGTDFVFNDIMGTPPALARQMARQIARTPGFLRSPRSAPGRSALLFGAGLIGAVLAGLMIRAGRQVRTL